MLQIVALICNLSQFWEVDVSEYRTRTTGLIALLTGGPAAVLIPCY
jgi:hypothetical protein